MSRAKVRVHPPGSPHPTEHTFEGLLKRIVSVPRHEVDKHMAAQQRKKKRAKKKP